MTFLEANELADLLEQLGGAPEEVFRQSELWKLQRDWRAAFAPSQKSWSGDLGKVDWHIFSYGVVSALERELAIDAYEAQPREELIVAVTLDRGPAFRCRFGAGPRYVDIRSGWRGDLYTVNAAMTWTFVMTHEELCGPYYIERFTALEWPV
jgi:hypothetical protein